MTIGMHHIARLPQTVKNHVRSSKCNLALVLRYVHEPRETMRGDVIELCKIRPDQVTRLLRQLVGDGQLRLVGERKKVSHVALSITGDDK